MTVGKVKMIAPRLAVLMEDGAVLEVQADNRDLLSYEQVARKRGWPIDPKEGQIGWCTYLAWHGLRREGQIGPDVKYDDWAQLAVSIVPEVVETDPTQPDPGAGS